MDTYSELGLWKLVEVGGSWFEVDVRMDTYSVLWLWELVWGGCPYGHLFRIRVAGIGLR